MHVRFGEERQEIVRLRPASYSTLTGKRWAYLAVVLDLFARKPVGWAMSFSPDSRLTMKALEMAWETRGKPVGVMFQAIKAVIIRAGSSGSYCGDTRSDRV